MKLKEYPKSLYSSLKLMLTPIKKLGEGSSSASLPVIVTLTSIPSRLTVLSITIRSLLNQSVRPEKIILWLNSNLKNNIPNSLRKLESSHFEIRFKPGTSSHRKLVFALTEYPNHTLVTCDDDLIYPVDWLERLLNEHKLHPNKVIAHECRNIAYETNGKLLPYKYWKSAQPGESTPNTLAIGYGGTLYPPNALDGETVNQELFLQLTPKADDLWFKAMALRKGTAVYRSQAPTPKPIPIAFSQKIALGHTNIKQDGNRSQWQALVDYYHFPTNAKDTEQTHD
ncbi:glycosyltransferase family A protein [Reinekea marina]|uniref:Glycosyltransferase family A protein n=1 Tax=Reinekea marina TaxID=1310421 RepID=A0ABV7WSR6_9GAMM|nr:glycosyltransferase family A protein [Reinekea marina]MDN3649327.1 glycosyltransferase family A protein [Reinekea marina]